MRRAIELARQGENEGSGGPIGCVIVRDGKVVAEPNGCLGGYYPEMNPLMALSRHDVRSKTPAAKSVPVRICK